MGIARYRIKRFVAREGERTGDYLRRIEHIGEAARCDFTVSRVPESSKTPVKIALVASEIESSEADSQRIECELYLSLPDAEQLSHLLNQVATQPE